MRIRHRTLVLLAGLVLAAPLQAADFTAGPIEIEDLWVRASAPGQTNGAGYMEIENSGSGPDRLVAVRSSAAERVELHTVVTENGVARMTPLEQGLAVPAGGEAELAPGGNHVMFIGLKAPFAEGGTVPATLQFEHAGEVQVQFKVQPLTYRGAAAGQAGHGHGGHGSQDHAHGMKH